MNKKIPAKVLEGFFEALNRPNRRAERQGGATIVDDILAEGWAFPWQLEDLLLTTDSRIHRPDIEALASYFDIPVRHVCRRPRFLNAGAVFHEGFAAVDAAALLIRLEEVGFDTAPQRLVQGVLPTLSTSRYLTESALLAMEYERFKGRSHIVLQSDVDDGDDEWEVSKIKDATGRQLEFTRVGDRAYRLEVRGPKYRSAPVRKTVTCEYCGYRHTKGDPESALAHRTEHARIRRLHDPTPLPAFATRAPLGIEGERVDASAPKWMHQAVYERAVRIKHELGFDFVQWEGNSKRKNLDPKSCAYLLSDDTGLHPPGTIAGACAFWKDADSWRLRWVWVCPKLRRSGILTRRWTQFLHLYGDFEVEAPLSEEMRAFLMRHGTTVQVAALGGVTEVDAPDLP